MRAQIQAALMSGACSANLKRMSGSQMTRYALSPNIRFSQGMARSSARSSSFIRCASFTAAPARTRSRTLRGEKRSSSTGVRNGYSRPSTKYAIRESRQWRRCDNPSSASVSTRWSSPLQMKW